MTSELNVEKTQPATFEVYRIEMSITMTTLTKTSVIPLAHAVLCLDCNCVTDAKLQCPACSSRDLATLSTILDRERMCLHSPNRSA